MKICKVKNCDKSAFYKDDGKRGFCQKHYRQWQRHKKIFERTKYDLNEIIDYGDYYEICLYNKKCEEIARTKINKEDLEKVKEYKWYLSKYKYAENGKSGLKLHQLIMGKKNGYEIDHVNHDILNNRRQNLRFVTSSQNNMNRKANGYNWDKKRNKWASYIKVNYKSIYLGCFIDKNDAINARRKAEKKYFGEFAYKEII